METKYAYHKAIP